MTLLRFAQSLGGRFLASLSRWGDAPSLRSVAGGTLPRFAQSLSIEWFHQIAPKFAF